MNDGVASSWSRVEGGGAARSPVRGGVRRPVAARAIRAVRAVGVPGMPGMSGGADRVGVVRAGDAGRMLLVGLAVAVGWSTALVAGASGAIALFTLVGLAALAAGVVVPVAGLMGVGLLCCIDSVSRVYLMSGGLLRWNTFNYLLMAVMVVGLPRLVRERSAQALLIAGLVAVQVLGLVHSQNRASGYQVVLGLASFLGILMVVRSVGWRPRWFLWLAYVVAVVSGVGSGVLLGIGAGASEMNKNSYAYFPLCGVLAICAVLPLAGRRGPWLRVFVPLLLVNVFWVFATGSRGVTVVALLGVGWMMLCLPSAGLRAWTLLAGAVAVVLLAGAAATQLEYSLERIGMTLDTTRSLANRTSGRSDLAVAGVALFLSNPLGVGTGSFSFEYARISREISVTSFEGKNLAAHSAWVRTLAENGLVGFGLLAGFVWSFVARGLRAADRRIRWTGIMTGLVLGVSFLATEFQSKPLWLLGAMVVAIGEPGRRIGVVGTGVARRVGQGRGGG